MIAIARALGLLAQELIGRWWWQLPLIAATIASVLLWDSARIARHVEKGKQEVRVEINEANDVAVQKAERVRDKSGSGRVRAVGKNRDPYTID